MLTTLLKEKSNYKIKIGPSNTKYHLVKELYENCLFFSTKNQFINKTNIKKIKCKTSNSRQSTFNLLIELTRDCQQNIQELISMLISHHLFGILF